MLELILFIIACVVVFNIWLSLHRSKLVKEGKADYFVKVAASGKGSVYHKLSCGKCTSWHELTVTEAQQRGYPPCATCGGYGKFKILSQR